MESVYATGVGGISILFLSCGSHKHSNLPARVGYKGLCSMQASSAIYGVFMCISHRLFLEVERDGQPWKTPRGTFRRSFEDVIECY